MNCKLLSVLHQDTESAPLLEELMMSAATENDLF